jgi:hypothetical protein
MVGEMSSIYAISTILHEMESRCHPDETIMVNAYGGPVRLIRARNDGFHSEIKHVGVVPWLYLVVCYMDYPWQQNTLKELFRRSRLWANRIEQELYQAYKWYGLHVALAESRFRPMVQFWKVAIANHELRHRHDVPPAGNVLG